MVLSDVSIKRPVFATMLMVSLLLFGYLGIRGMGVDQFPRVDFPIVTITTRLAGASPAITESDLTQPIEEQLNTIEGVKHVTSSSGLGVSLITVEFELERDIDIAAQDVRDKVALARAELPADAEEPVIQKVDINAQPVVWITLTGLDIKTMSQVADEVLKPRLQTLAGVGEVRLGGFREREMRIWLDRNRLEAYQLTATDVIRAVQTKSVELPAGILESPQNEYRVNVRGQLANPQEFNDLVVMSVGDSPVRLRDLGYAEDGLEPRRALARFNGEEAVGLGVAPRPGANTVAVARLVKERLGEVQSLLPPGMNARVAFDSSRFIEESISGAEHELIFGALFAVLVVFLFLRSWRSTIVVALTIPTSLVAAFGLMRAFDFTINNLTMLALSLSVGVVVDDAIVVLENIFHHLERGANPREAAQVGTSEIAFAALAATFSIAAVFIPVALIPGLIGRFLFQFGISVAVAVLLSLLVALTLTPMMASRFLQYSQKHGRLYGLLERAFTGTDAGYRRLLDWALTHRGVTVAIGAGAFLLALVLIPFIGTEFVPNQDESRFIIRLRTPIGSSIDYTDRFLAEAEQRLLADSAVSGVFSAVGLGGTGGVDQAFAFVNLVPRGERDRDQDQIMAQFRQSLNQIPGIVAFVERVSAVGGGQRNTPIQLVLKGPDLAELGRTAVGLTDSLRKVPGFVDVDHDLQLEQPELNVLIHRDLAASLGVSALDVSQTVSAMIGSLEISDFKTGGQRYDVRIQVLPEQRATPADLTQLTTRSEGGDIVRLASMVQGVEESGVNSIQRQDQQRVVNVFANLRPELALGDALPVAIDLAQGLLPPGYSVATSGQSEQFADAFGDLLFAVALSIGIIYILLAIQFEHFLHPLTLMLALPLALTGAFALMVATGTRLGIMGMIGMILLMGLVMKNSILLIDLTNKLREQGMELREALMTACPRRLRPILMTSAAIIFGVFPVAAQLTEGSELRAPMAIAVIGGVFSSTLLTLLVVPVVYTYIDALPGRLRRLVPALRLRRADRPAGGQWEGEPEPGPAR